MKITIPDEVYKKASEATRGIRQMEIIGAYLADKIEAGDEMSHYERDDKGTLSTVTRTYIPEKDVPDQFKSPPRLK